MNKQERILLFQELNVTKDEMKQIYQQLKQSQSDCYINGKNLSEYKFKELDRDDFIKLLEQKNSIRTETQNTNQIENSSSILEEYDHDKNFEKWMLHKLINNQLNDISIKDIKELVYNYEIQKIEGTSGRWTRDIQSICEICNVVVAVNWQEGLTEMQEDEFYDRPYFVKPIEQQITVTNYIKWDQPVFIKEEPVSNIETNLENESNYNDCEEDLDDYHDEEYDLS